MSTHWPAEYHREIHTYPIIPTSNTGECYKGFTFTSTFHKTHEVADFPLKETIYPQVSKQSR